MGGRVADALPELPDAAKSTCAGEPGGMADGLPFPFLHQNAIPLLELAAASTVSSSDDLRGGVRRADAGRDLEGDAVSASPAVWSGSPTAGSDRALSRSLLPPAWWAPCIGEAELEPPRLLTLTDGLGVSPVGFTTNAGWGPAAEGAVAVTAPAVERSAGTFTAAAGTLGAGAATDVPEDWLLLDKLLLSGRIFTIGFGLQPMPNWSPVPVPA